MKLFYCRSVEDKDAFEPFLPTNGDPKVSSPTTVTEVSESYFIFFRTKSIFCSHIISRI